MLKPATRDLKVYTSGTFSTSITLWKNLTPLEAFPLEEYTPSLIVDDIVTLTVGNGLTVTENKLSVLLTAEQTDIISPGTRAHYYVKFVKGSEVVFPMHGTMSFVSP